jgi:4-hydroxybenzoate polyprenyltransferase
MIPLGPALALLRPKQWVKNLFVLAPLIFAKELFNAGPASLALRALVAFCLTASAVYILNDIFDVKADRAHPVKKFRPIAAGVLTVPQSLFLLLLLLVAASFVVAGMDTRFLILLGGYLVMNLVYSVKLKEVLLLDVFIVAAGFMLRVLCGAYAINVQVSSWIVLCSLFISLFLGFAKRRGELMLMQETGTTPERKVLTMYRVDFIDQMITIAAAGAVISYAMYSVAPRTTEIFGTDKLIYTTVFVIYGVFRYLYLIHTTPATENPTNAVTSDPGIVLTTTLWIISCIVLIYYGRYVPDFGR